MSSSFYCYSSKYLFSNSIKEVIILSMALFDGANTKSFFFLINVNYLINSDIVDVLPVPGGPYIKYIY